MTSAAGLNKEALYEIDRMLAAAASQRSEETANNGRIPRDVVHICRGPIRIGVSFLVERISSKEHSNLAKRVN